MRHVALCSHKTITSIAFLIINIVVMYSSVVEIKLFSSIPQHRLSAFIDHSITYLYAELLQPKGFLPVILIGKF